MDRSAYDDYLAKFNARDYEGILAYYADEMELVFAGYRFTSKDAVRKFYGFFHQYVAEQIEVRRFVGDESTVAIEVDVRLVGLQDLTPQRLAAEGLDRLVGLAAGQVVHIPQFIHYHLAGGKIVGACCAVFDAPQG